MDAPPTPHAERPPFFQAAVAKLPQPTFDLRHRPLPRIIGQSTESAAQSLGKKCEYDSPERGREQTAFTARLITQPRRHLRRAGFRTIFLSMRPPLFPPSISRLHVRPDHDDPNAVVAPRRTGRHGQPHADATVAAVRRLIEQSTLSYGEIRARTGVSHASICRWTRDQGWKRPPFAPRANDLVPAPRASAQLRRRTLAARLDALAQRHIRELEESACVDPEKLGEALELLKMARLAARRLPRRRVGDLAEPEEFRRPIIQLCAAGRRPLPRPACGGRGFSGEPANARPRRPCRRRAAAPSARMRIGG